MTTADRKKDIYDRIKIAGALSILPFVLAAGPFAGFILGDYLEKKFSAGPFVMIICVLAGFAAGAMETARIIRFTLKAQAKK